eukprot:COSAG01_NODE_1_length_100484_cov_170.446142_115_plen_761_part_00
MSLSKQEEQDILDLLKRPASQTEKIIFETMWSEHCSYKSTKPTLKQLPTKGSEVVLGIGEDAGIIAFQEHDGIKYGIAVAHESHNHPSQILPIEGAATGVGGVVRDVYCMGSDVIGVLNSLHFGVNEDGKSHMVEEIAHKVVQGVSEYGNALGVPVLGGETLYHPSYNDNCLVNVAAVGLIDTAQIIHSKVPAAAKDEPYVLILIGKSTDATGFGGASFSSQTLDEDNSSTNVGAVQVHDPFLKRVIVEATKVLFETIKEHKIDAGFKDLGAGGIACAGSELGISGGFGVELNLDDINVALEGLAPEVIACSETQERYCLAVPAHFAPAVLKIYNEQFELPKLYPNAGAAVIGKVIQEPKFKLKHQGAWVCDLPIAAITTDVSVKRESLNKPLKSASDDHNALDQAHDTSTEALQALALKIVQDQNCMSKRYVYRFFDNAVRGDTVIYPGEADAVVVTPIQGCDAALAVSMDSNLYGHADPYLAGAAAVAESVRNVVAVGARPIALTDCLNYGNPEKPEYFYEFEQGVKGIADAARALSFIPNEDLPLVSGNVSLYNESKKGKSVIPSPVILTLGKLDHYQAAKTMQIFEAGLNIYMLAKPKATFAGTLVAQLGASTKNCALALNLTDEAKQNHFIHAAYQAKQIEACHDISLGGLWQCLVEMVLGERGLDRVGLDITLPEHEDFDAFTCLFSEVGGFVFAAQPAVDTHLQAAAKKQGVSLFKLGQSKADKKINITYQKQAIIQLDNAILSQLWNQKNPW